MTRKTRELRLPSGHTLSFPAYIPVTTWGDAYPLDKIIRPYLPRLSQAVMVSYHYAKQMSEAERTSLPLWVDSGGFACLFENARLVDLECAKNAGPLGGIEIVGDEGKAETIDPHSVLEFQERTAQVGFTLDFPIPPGTALEEASRRLERTIANALWASENCRSKKLALYACVQGWDVESYRQCAESYRDKGFAGLAVGGLVPRSRDEDFLREVIEAVRKTSDLPLHVFGIGKPGLVRKLFAWSVDSVDSSSYVKMAADGRLWGNPDFRISEPSATERMHLALCNLASASGASLPLSSLSFVTDFLNTARKGQHHDQDHH